MRSRSRRRTGVALESHWSRTGSRMQTAQKNRGNSLHLRPTFAPPDAKPRGTEWNGRGPRVTAEASDRAPQHDREPPVELRGGLPCGRRSSRSYPKPPRAENAEGDQLPPRWTPPRATVLVTQVSASPPAPSTRHRRHRRRVHRPRRAARSGTRRVSPPGGDEPRAAARPDSPGRPPTRTPTLPAAFAPPDAGPRGTGRNR
jgi:hypothetical protein